MDEEDPAWTRRQPFHPRDELVLIGVGAEPVHTGDLGAHPHRLSEHIHGLGAVTQTAAQRSLGLETDEQHGVVLVPETVRQVMEDPTALAHSRRRDDDAGVAPVVERARLVR